MENLFTAWPFWAVLVYLIIRDIIPLLIRFMQSAFGQILPIREKRLDKQIQADIDRELKLDDLRERQIISQEQVGKTLVLVAEKVARNEDRLISVTASLATANQALAIILDRVQRSNPTDTV